MRVALKFAYDGREFAGYARQPQQKTVEETLLKFLCDQGYISDVKHACFRTASRTDRGVSALGNVCAFNTALSKDTVFQSVTKVDFPIFVYGIQTVSPGFYPRHAKRREYRYYLKRNTLDVDDLLSAASVFTGKHNFQNFARVEPLKNPVRTIDNIVVTEHGEFLVIDFYAETFLWNQIRRIVSGMQKVGDKKLTQKQVRDALAHPENKIDYGLAVPEFLLLKDVIFEFEFYYKKGYMKKLKAFENSIMTSW